MTGPTPAPRCCPLCGNPTGTKALVEAHIGPTRQHPKADVVVWLCLPCAQEVSDPGHTQEVSDPGHTQPSVKGQQW